ncbi:MAG: ABC transporter ATP-binding protein [Thalassobaculaceae bacterium]|nr:ABC transporter ATP-binding protein [Thalassobaculaceae bacterium]
MSAPLEITGLTAGYGRTVVLHGIDLPAWSPGTVVGLLGQNAAGKSTLLKALSGQVRYSGEARFNGQGLAGLSARHRASIVGYQPQAAPLATGLLVYEAALATFHATAPDLGRDEADRRIGAAFSELGLSNLALRRVDTLSGGQRQLLSLSLVLARQTPLMLLDEPTSALDLRWQIQTLQAIRRAAEERNALVLIAIHDLNLALRFCDEVAVLHHGRVLAAGPAAATVTPDLLRDAYGIEGRIERCSAGLPIVVADGATATSPPPGGISP